MVTPRSIGGKANRRRARLEGFGDGTIENPLNLKENNTDKNIFDDSYLLVSNTFPGFPALGEPNCLLLVKAFN